MSAIIEGFNSTVTPPIFTNQIKKACKVFSRDMVTWKKANTTLKFQLPTEQTKQWFIKNEFSLGGDSKAYRVFDTDGKQAVLKFYFDEELSSLQTESERWEDINEINLSRIVVVKKKYALLTPYLEPLTESEKQQFLNEKSGIFKQISLLFDICVEKGLCQMDASWRHVGWFKYDAVPQIKIIDFGYLVKFDCNNVDEKKEMKELMLSNLYDELRYA